MMVADYWSAFGRKLAAWQHGRAVRHILDTPPIVPMDDGVILFSMIGTAVLLPYLVAVKSLHAQLQRGRVMLLDDGTLTDADKAVLAHHVGNPQILTFADIDTAPCPKGNCWERLLAILDLRREHYVIQLDSRHSNAGAGARGGGGNCRQPQLHARRRGGGCRAWLYDGPADDPRYLSRWPALSAYPVGD